MQETQRLIQETAQRLSGAVVGLGRGARGGSGVVIAPERVVTLAHLLRGDEVVVSFADGREAVAQVLGSDPDVDVALLAVDTREAEPAQWADGEPVAIGTPVVAVANPGGRGLRATAGYVSSGPRRLRGWRGRLVADAIEHTAPLPRGSGGGALVDAAGQLLGLNAVRLDGGLILALPARALRERVEAIDAGRPPRARRLGVAVIPPRAARRMRRAVGLAERDGLLVRAVEADSPAEHAGVQRGDLIVAAGGRPVTGIDDLYLALDAASDGSLALGVVRGAEELELTAPLDAGAAETV